jgi:hypothetical protein
MSGGPDTRYPYGFPTGNLSEAKIEELNKIREAILANARRKVDPEGRGFDAQMMASSDDGGFFPSTDDWFDWRDRFINVLSLVSQRVSLAVLSAGFAIAGANMVGTERAGSWGQASLAVAGVFAAWSVVANLMGPKSGR